MVNEQRFPFLAEMFGEAIRLISLRADRDKFLLLEVVRKNDEARFEEALQRIAGLLQIKTPKELKQVFEIEAKEFAGTPTRWRNFIGEILVLFKLVDGFGFSNFKKLSTKKNTANPDYTASYNSLPFTIEVKHTVRDEGEELKAIDHKAYNVPILLADIEQMVEERRHKFERQLAVYPNHRRIAAFGYEGLPATGTFLNEFDTKEIAEKVLGRAGGKIDHILIMSTQLNNTHLVPDLSQYSI